MSLGFLEIVYSVFMNAQWSPMHISAAVAEKHWEGKKAHGSRSKVQYCQVASAQR